MVKQALLDVAAELKLDFAEPTSREELGAADGSASASRASTSPSATPSARETPKPRGKFVNTWSVEGFIAEGLQPSELGWGTHEKALPAGGARHDFGCDAAIYLKRPGAGTRVRSWTPTAQAQHAWMITHNEFDLDRRLLHGARQQTARCVYRPTCHYAYHPCDDAVLSLHEMAGQGVGAAADVAHPDRGRHRRRRRRARRAALRPRQERLLVRLLALDRGDAPARALPERHRPAGDLARCSPASCGCWRTRTAASWRPTSWTSAAAWRSSGRISATCSAHYTDWTPLAGRGALFPEDVDHDDPWQFKNVLVV